jgi:hypothetical protein
MKEGAADLALKVKDVLMIKNVKQRNNVLLLLDFPKVYVSESIRRVNNALIRTLVKEG